MKLFPKPSVNRNYPALIIFYKTKLILSSIFANMFYFLNSRHAVNALSQTPTT